MILTWPERGVLALFPRDLATAAGHDFGSVEGEGFGDVGLAPHVVLLREGRVGEVLVLGEVELEREAERRRRAARTLSLAGGRYSDVDQAAEHRLVVVLLDQCSAI